MCPVYVVIYANFECGVYRFAVAKCVGASTFGWEFGNLTDIYVLFGVMTLFCIMFDKMSNGSINN